MIDCLKVSKRIFPFFLSAKITAQRSFKFTKSECLMASLTCLFIRLRKTAFPDFLDAFTKIFGSSQAKKKTLKEKKTFSHLF